MADMTAKAYAKINLTLDIIGTMPNGYHEIETIMQTVTLHDNVGITISKADTDIKIICTDKTVPCDGRNTCYKAVELFFQELGIKKSGVTVELEKHIPSQAGLGGGSSDAAAVLIMLSKLIDTGIPDALSADCLRSLAAKIGADVPFFIDGGTAVCRGIGDIITPVDICEQYNVLLVMPDFGISTQNAYKEFDKRSIPSKHSTAAIISAIRNGNDITKLISNDLESVCCHNAITDIKQLLIKLGADGALMTGSGSCVFGLFKSFEECFKAYELLKNKYSFVRQVETI